MKFGLDHQNPLVTGAIMRRGRTAPTRRRAHSLLTISNPGVLLWALKPHDDGIAHGLVARVWNLAAEPGLVRLTTASSLASAQRITHLETPLEPLPVTNGVLEITVPAQRLESLSWTPRR